MKREIIVSLVTLISLTNVFATDYRAKTKSVATDKGTALYKADSNSIREHYVIPEWFRDAKFGIFIHWGVYSVPAFHNEWYARNMYQEDQIDYKHHKQTWGDHTVFGYKDFIPIFKAQNFDPKQWVELFKKSGAKYVVPVAEHHDGFSMYDSELNPWNSVKMGPKRDVVGELKKEIQRQGLIFGLSSHRIENGWFFNGGMKFPSDVQDTSISMYGRRLPGYEVFDNHTVQDWLEHTYELIDKYQPELIWFDWTVGKKPMQENFYKFLAYYYNNSVDWKKPVVVNTKFNYSPDVQVWDIERGKSDEVKKHPWQTDTSVGKNSWSYVVNEQYKTAGHIVHDLIDIVSKNGNLLLNIGPKADGTIPSEVCTILTNIGEWLKVNGEAIYGTRPYTVSGEGDVKGTSGSFTDNEASAYTAKDIRFTTKGNTIYAISLGWDKEIIVKSLKEVDNIISIRMLGSKEKINWVQTSLGLKIVFPKNKPCDYSYIFKITRK